MGENREDQASGASEEKYSTGEVPEADLHKPSLFALLFSGLFSGAVLGSAESALFYFLTDWLDSLEDACAVGAGIGLVGGALFVLFKRAIWGPNISLEI